MVYGDGSTESYRYRADGALLAARNAAATVEFERDVLGAVLTERQNGHTVSSRLDQRGQRTGLTSSLGADVRLQLGALGAVEEIKANEGWQASFARDSQGLELHRYYSAGLRTSWRRDQLGRPVEQRIGAGPRPTAGPSSTPQERIRHYAWQQNERLTSIDDSALGRTRYQHDAVGNLAATVFADGTEQLRLPDAVGNLFQTADRRDRRYGPAGQLLEARGVRYDYDAAGHLAEVLRPDGGVVRFAYDALGRRVSKSYKGQVTRWVWDGDQPLHEWTELELNGQNTEEVITWLFEPKSFAPLARLQGQQPQSIVCDHLGTPLEMHDAQGGLSWAVELDSYGAVRKQRGEAGACPFRYQGQYEDAETGLYYNRFRYYDPLAGQYISQDPIGLEGGPWPYTYAGDTTTWVDPYGLSSCPAKRPGGHRTGDVETHGTLSPGVNRAPGHTNTRPDNFVQSHHPIQNEWAKRNRIAGYNENDAPATLLRSSSGNSHARISAMQRARRRALGGWSTSLRDEFQISYREMIDAGVPKAQVQKAFQKAYRYFDSIGAF